MEKKHHSLNPISRLAETMAKITLTFNFFVNEFIDLYKYHLVKLVKKQNPDFNITQIAARTNLDRRFVRQVLADNGIQSNKSRISTVLQQMRVLCLNKGQPFIAKHGAKNSFDALCKQMCSGALSTKAVAQELMRQGKIIEHSYKYEVLNLSKVDVDKSIQYYENLKIIFQEIKKVCLQRKVSFIKKSQGKHSFKSICESFGFEGCGYQNTASYLTSRGLIAEVDDEYHINDFRLIRGRDDWIEYVAMIVNQLNLLINSMLYFYEKGPQAVECFQMKYYATQVHPKSYEEIKVKLFDILRPVGENIMSLLEEYEEDVPWGTYPEFGVSIFGFDEYHHNLPR